MAETSDLLVFKAGKTALAHIREKGLQPSDIRAVLGASGAAKWLAIYGLDRMIFSRWLNSAEKEIYILGTSIGAWKMSAAAQADPARAFDRLKEAYIHQRYRGRVTPEQITTESLKILDILLPPEKIREILTNPRFRLGFAAVRCRGVMAAENKAAQIAGMSAAFMMNLASRSTQSLFFRRTLFHAPGFHAPGSGHWPLDMNDFPTTRVVLDRENFKYALLASGSIPVIMDGIADIPAAPKGMYRDGGILDYHPVFPLDQGREGLILYPHFYPEITPGWFDKKISGRRAKGSLVDRTILVAPSPAFVAGLPWGRIPDRKDFTRFHGNDDERFRVWQTAAERSLELGNLFLEAVENGRIRDIVRPF